MTDGTQRIERFIAAALADQRPPADDWRDAVKDAVTELHLIVASSLAHPDSVAHARIALSILAGIWLSVDEVDEVFLGTADHA